MILDMQKRQYDYLTGALQKGVYFLSRIRNDAVRKYLAGLLDVHLLCGNEQALSVLEKMTAYFKARMDALHARGVEVNMMD